MANCDVNVLRNEQLQILRFMESGHNVCIFGKAGVEKSTLVEAMKQKLTQRGLKCEISCDVYNGLANNTCTPAN